MWCTPGICSWTNPILSLHQTSRHLITYHSYADDTQLFNSFLPSHTSQVAACHQLENCIDEVQKWMDDNMLELNSDKTEAILIGPQSRLKKCKVQSLNINESIIPFTSSVKNLGIHIDSSLTMERHVSYLCKISHYQLGIIGSIRHLITRDAAATLVRCMVMSRLDYGNSLFMGTSKQQIQRLQQIQNKCARIVTRSKQRCHISPVLDSLHWLRISERIEFKILCLTYQPVSKMAPTYLQELVHPYVPSRRLRSSDQLLLKTPIYNLKTFGARSFSYASATLWNNLPLKLKNAKTLSSFKSNLKTYLFKRDNSVVE
ncbi:hypothetical protein SNE40_014299 [Patella caerulea]|uniref:Reverse transcriptase domain-containing protein n=1 Tax=Patella caerulea TaxID=87958 RepID=A0AAN8JJV1_PATCE